MDTQDQTKPTTPSSSGHESHGVHICHRCGWPFPNPHPSKKHRRAHNRICGTIEGYTNTNLIIPSSETVSVSDDEHHSDEDEDKDKDKTPSPKIVTNSGGVGERSNKSEEDLFSDAKTEFSDSVISPDMTNLLESPINVRKLDSNIKLFGTADFHSKDADKTEQNDVNIVRNSLDTSDPKPSEHWVKDKDGLDPTKFTDVTSTNVDIVEGSDNKGREEEAAHVLSVPSDIPLVDHAETLIEDFKDHKSKHSKVPVNLDTFEIETEKVKIEESQPSENVESSMESVVSEPTNPEFLDFAPTEETKMAETQSLEMSKTDLSEETASVERASEEIDQGKVKTDHERVSEVVEEAEVDHRVPVLTEDLVTEPESVKEPESGSQVEQKMVASVSDDSKDCFNGGNSQRSIIKPEESHNGSTVSETLIPTQDCGVDPSVGSSSRNSLEGNWGSVSVLSTASIDAENVQSLGKSETDKRRSGKPDAFTGPPLIELEDETSVDRKTSEIDTVSVQTEASRAGWVSSEADETEGRKRNEEAIAKVTNWSTGEPGKNTVREAKISDRKRLSNTAQKDEAAQKISEPRRSKTAVEAPPVMREASPPEYSGEGKKGRKKGKRRASWMPFVCCSSVNVS